MRVGDAPSLRRYREYRGASAIRRLILHSLTASERCVRALSNVVGLADND